MRKTLNISILIFLALFITIFNTSCAKKDPVTAQDPFENMNRFTYAVFVDLDHLFLKPTATAYAYVVPRPLQKGVTNVFDNIGVITTVPNDLFQGKLKFAYTSLWRLMINSTVGVGGLFDIATRLGFPKHENDFGLTLAYWTGGATKSAYVFSPMSGPSTLRGAIGGGIDYLLSPWPYIDNSGLKYGVFAVRTINRRASYLKYDKYVQASFDQYAFIREAYLRRRNNEVVENTKPYKTIAQRKEESKLLDENETDETDTNHDESVDVNNNSSDSGTDGVSEDLNHTKDVGNSAPGEKNIKTEENKAHLNFKKKINLTEVNSKQVSQHNSKKTPSKKKTTTTKTKKKMTTEEKVRHYSKRLTPEQKLERFKNLSPEEQKKYLRIYIDQMNNKK